MSRIISVHSFRRGTGKTNLLVSIAAMMAAVGKRVGLVDTNTQSPGTQLLLGVGEEQTPRFLNDYLNGACPIEDAAVDVTEQLSAALKGRLFLIPANPDLVALAEIARGGFDLERLDGGYQRLIEKLRLDVLLVDTQAGINEQNIVSLAASDGAVIVFRLDQQDYQGTAVLVDLSRKLGLEEVMLIVNDIPSTYDLAQVKATTEKTYEAEVIGLMPHTEELMALASKEVFALRYPDHPLTGVLKGLAARLAR